MSSPTWRDVLFGLALWLCVPVSDLTAQSLSLGDRIRVQSTQTYASDGEARKGAYTTTGALSRWANDTLRIDTDGQMRVSIYVSNVEKLEVSRGQTHRAPKGMVIGAAIGFTFGFLFGSTVAYGFDGTNTEAAGAGLASGAVGAGVGLVTGAIIGALHSTDAWEEVPVGDLRVSLSSSSLAFRISI